MAKKPQPKAPPKAPVDGKMTPARVERILKGGKKC